MNIPYYPGQHPVAKDIVIIFSTLSWEEIIKDFQQSLDHLGKLGCPAIADMKSSSDVTLNNYSLLFDLSRSDQKKVRVLN